MLDVLQRAGLFSVVAIIATYQIIEEAPALWPKGSAATFAAEDAMPNSIACRSISIPRSRSNVDKELRLAPRAILGREEAIN